MKSLFYYQDNRNIYNTLHILRNKQPLFLLKGISSILPKNIIVLIY